MLNLKKKFKKFIKSFISQIFYKKSLSRKFFTEKNVSKKIFAEDIVTIYFGKNFTDELQ